MSLLVPHLNFNRCCPGQDKTLPWSLNGLLIRSTFPREMFIMITCNTDPKIVSITQKMKHPLTGLMSRASFLCPAACVCTTLNDVVDDGSSPNAQSD